MYIGTISKNLFTGILIVSLWRYIWLCLDNYLGDNLKTNTIFIILVLIVYYFINPNMPI